ncbi:MAG: hypothetical protein KatS3mg001_537 [Candidatus Pacearchaeota archaeon]|nr:MAG: hypothetical protein KatS3mg001_537 [Candidatus Pacearchaeota archaeon]
MSLLIQNFLSGPYNMNDFFLKSMIPNFIITFIFLFILLLLIFYVYFSLAWYTIAKKVKHKRPWLAWIPFANIAMWFQMGGFHWALVFLLIIPFVGSLVVMILLIISNWRVFEKLRYPGWLSLSPVLGLIFPGLGIIAYGIVIGIVAWRKNR